MFTKVPICLRYADAPTRVINALLSVEHISSVFSHDEGRVSSVMLVSGDKITVNIPYNEFSQRLLEFSTKTPY